MIPKKRRLIPKNNLLNYVYMVNMVCFGDKLAYPERMLGE
jgi:hypothetical protein